MKEITGILRAAIFQRFLPLHRPYCAALRREESCRLLWQEAMEAVVQQQLEERVLEAGED